VTKARKSSNSPSVPPPQTNLARAVEMAYEAVANQSDEQLQWLGAEGTGGIWWLPVLNDMFEVDLATHRLRTSAGLEVGPHWCVLVLHYLAIASRPERKLPEVTFADLATARSYASVYQGRVIGRLCATVARNAETLRKAADTLSGRPVEGGDAAFDFDVFPRLSLRLIWHGPDEEFPPSATMLLPRNIESYFCSEDIVVLSEQLVSRLSDRPF
jgi:hypothetical protein